MKDCLVVCSSNRLYEHQTVNAIQALVMSGACLLEQRDTGDVTLARNIALSKALLVLEKTDYQVVLMIDDDMAFNLGQAQALTEYVRNTKEPASGVYILADGKIAGSHYRDGKWLTGLGFLALHRDNLIALAEKSRKFRPNKTAPMRVTEFTFTSLVPDGDGELVFDPEDFCFTRRLGGVKLLPIGVGHVKKRVLVISQEQVEKICSEPRS